MKVDTLVNIQSIAIEVLKNEAHNIELASQRINDNFENCVQAIYECKGRLVITGIGKSAIIANKIVSTLNSTGTPSLFMHAADAIHGDLGMIRGEDIVMCISKSGNTSEIKSLVPLLRRNNNQLIALVSNTDSYLAKHSDFIIDGTISEEACPNKLAPTTSTTVHLALGDALAVCLLKLRNFTSLDFAFFHPGGALGRQLYLKISDVITGQTMPMVDIDSSMRNVILEISSNRMGATLVVKNQELAGIITDGDLRRMLQNNESVQHLMARDIMTKNPKIIDVNDYASDALKKMRELKIAHLAVMKNQQVVGLVHLQDLLKEGIL